MLLTGSWYSALNGMIKAGQNCLNEGIPKNLHNRLPSAQIRAVQPALEINLGRNLLSLPALQKMRRTANRQFFSLMQNASVFVLFIVVHFDVREHWLDISSDLLVVNGYLRIHRQLPRGHVEASISA